MNPTNDAKNREKVVNSKAKCRIYRIKCLPLSLFIRLKASSITRHTDKEAKRVIHWVTNVHLVLFVVGGMMHISKVIETVPIVATDRIMPKSKFALSSESRVLF